MGDRQRVSTGTKWEELYGYSRGIRTGNSIQIAGTTATDENGQVVGGDDPYEQTRFIFQKIERALNALGGTLEDVVRTRLYVVQGVPWEPVARAHGDLFSEIRPANTVIYIAGLIGDQYLVEVEVDAIVEDSE